MLAEFSIYPMGRSHFSNNIALAIETLEAKGVRYRLGPMGTCIEGTWFEIMSAIDACRQAVGKESKRVIVNIAIDTGLGGEFAIEEAVRRVEEQLSHPVAQ